LWKFRDMLSSSPSRPCCMATVVWTKVCSLYRAMQQTRWELNTVTSVGQMETISPLSVESGREIGDRKWARTTLGLSLRTSWPCVGQKSATVCCMVAGSPPLSILAPPNNKGARPGAYFVHHIAQCHAHLHVLSSLSDV